MNEQQLCPFMTWGSKLAMIFAGLEAQWCHRFRASLVEELEIKAAREGLNLKGAAISQAGDNLVEYTIGKIHRFLGSEEAASAL